MSKKLKRSSNDKMIAGVCGGIGEYFNIDPIIVRIVWALLLFTPGASGFLLYLLCVIIIPKDDNIIYQDNDENTYNNRNNTPMFIGIGLVVLGGLMLAKIFWPHYIFRITNIFRYWPVLLIIVGIYIIYNQKNK